MQKTSADKTLPRFLGAFESALSFLHLMEADKDNRLYGDGIKGLETTSAKLKRPCRPMLIGQNPHSANVNFQH